MNIQLLRIAALAGLLSGIGCATYFILVFGNVLTSPLARYLDIWIPALAMIFSMWYVRGGRRDGHLHFWEALMMGNVTQLVTAFVSASILYVVLTYVSDAALLGYIEGSKMFIINSKANTIQQFGQQAYDEQIATIGQTTAKGIFADEFFKKITYMFLLVPLLSLILRNKTAYLPETEINLNKTV